MSSEIEAMLKLIADAGGANVKPFIIDAHEGRTYLAEPKVERDDDNNVGVGWEVKDITSPNKAEVLAPKIITQAVQLQTVETFNAYMHRFKNDDSTIFADISNNTLLGVIDYHTAANDMPRPPASGDTGTPPIAAPQANHTKHTARLQIPLSLEWLTWAGVDGKMFSHVEFANFLEENAMDILPLGMMKDSSGNVVEDAPTTIFELCREMQLRSSYGASSVVRNGDYVSVEMQKGDDITTKKNVSMPASINLSIPVYFGEEAVELVALMRQKASGDGKILMGIKLRRPEQVRQDEFKRIVSEVEIDVQLTTLYGKPA